MPTLCLGEALVDLVCERHVDRLPDAEAFVPHPGGATANVAIHAARTGAHVALGGGAGDDPWGPWLRDRLIAEGVDMGAFRLVAGARTPVALVWVHRSGEPEYVIHGEGLAAVATALRDGLEEAVAGADGLFFGSNTLVGDAEREVTLRARELALARELPVVIDANLRLGRWRTAADAAATVNACVPGAFLVRANAKEAELLTGERDPERAARALLKTGARLVVITLGAEGAILRGERRADAEGVAITVRSTVGAGDALTGTLLGRLALSGFYPSAAAVALSEAVLASARACERWAAL